MPIRVILADDHTLVRTGMKALLDQTQQVHVIGEASDGQEAVDLVNRLQPDVALLDVAMPRLNGIEAARQIAAGGKTAVLMLSMHSDRQYVFESLGAGAKGYVLKDAKSAELLTAISMVARGQMYLSPEVSAVAMDDYARRARGEGEGSELAVLSPREREVLQLVAEGRSSQEIAEALHVSVRTVETHRQSIMSKLKIRSIAGLTKAAIRLGITTV